MILINENFLINQKMEFHYYTIFKWKNVKQTHAPTYFTLIKNLGYIMKSIVQRINYSNFAITKMKLIVQRINYSNYSNHYEKSKILFLFWVLTYIVFTKECPKPGHSLGKRIRKHEMKKRKRNFAFLVFVHI